MAGPADKQTAKIGEGRPGPGRPKGSRNKTTTAVKEAVLQAFEKAGGVNYLVNLADNDPKTFCALLGKVIPLDVNHGAGDTLTELLRAIDGRTRRLPGSD